MGEVWIEQCWRDVLKIVWNFEGENHLEEFHRRVPPDEPLQVTFTCCQQFILSREMVRRRPLETWRKLLRIINEQDVCHIGEPDYENLYTYRREKKKVGPEPSTIIEAGDDPNQGYGLHTQGGAMEHLAHVVFGGKPMDMDFPHMDEICRNFVPDCPFTPCND
jgi:hypothetical protein